MVKRICPKCNTRWYSADTSNQIWMCQACKSEVPKAEEKPIDNSDYKEFHRMDQANYEG